MKGKERKSTKEIESNRIESRGGNSNRGHERERERESRGQQR
jgi:hypothetical protein